MLYQVETNGEDADRALIKYCSLFPYQEDIVEYARYLLAGITAHQEKIDEYHTAGVRTLADRPDHVC